MSHDDVLATIPHRPPFLFVDDIVELRDNGATCVRTFKPEEYFYAGHYPGNPITPGVLLCEAVFQTAAIFLVKKLQKQGVAAEAKTPVLCRIEEAKFKAMVLPGDTITIEVTEGETTGGFHAMKGVIRKDGKLAVSLAYTLALVDKK